MLRIITISLSLVFGLLLWSDLAKANDYASCEGCHKAKKVEEAVITEKGYDHCVKIATEGMKGEKGTMPPMKGKAETACKAKFGK